MNGIEAMGILVVSGDGEVNIHPSDCRRSAEPEEDVDARLPC